MFAHRLDTVGGGALAAGAGAGVGARWDQAILRGVWRGVAYTLRCDAAAAADAFARAGAAKAFTLSAGAGAGGNDPAGMAATVGAWLLSLSR